MPAQAWDESGNPVGGSTSPKAWDERGSPISLTPGTPNSGAVGRMVGSFAKAINPISPIVDLASDPKGLKHAVESQVFQPQADEFHKANEAAHGRGEFSGMNPLERTSEAIGHGVAGALPLVGPAAASAGEQIGSGDVAGGIGSGLGLVADTSAIPRLTKGLGKGVEAPAAGIAEKAMGITARDRQYGLGNGAIGRAILSETRGVRPDTVASSAENRIGTLAKSVDSAAQAANNRGVTVPLGPARLTVADMQRMQSAGNAGDVARSLGPAADFLEKPEPGFTGTTQYAPGATTPIRGYTQFAQNGGTLSPQVKPIAGASPAKVIAPEQNPVDFLNMRRRFNDQFGPGSWGSETPDTKTANFRNTYGALTKALHTAVPETGIADARIHALIPAAREAEAVSRKEGVWPRVMTRIERPTGGLMPAVAGYAVGGKLGAAVGGIVPEALSSPSARMITARGLRAAGKAIQAKPVGIAAGTLPLVRKTDDQE